MNEANLMSRVPRSLLAAVNIVLAAGVALLAVVLVLLFIRGSALGLVTRDQREQSTYSDITAAARQETLAFLDVDYRHMDPLMSRVLAGATGQFRSQYQHSTVNLKAASQTEKVMSHGWVRSVGISQSDPNSATVYVAADSTVTNQSTKAPQPRSWRIQMDLHKVAGRWLVGNLECVG